MTLTIDQGAALLWLRQAGGRAQSDRAGTVSFDRSICPITFPAFGHLDQAGLVEMRLPADLLECRLLVLLTEVGATLEIDPAAERRLDQLMRRFDD